jgi:hypothetical protein
MLMTFGRDTIRRFPTRASDQKKMAARDYEDYLQVRQIPQRRIGVFLIRMTVFDACVRRTIPWQMG